MVASRDLADVVAAFHIRAGRRNLSNRCQARCFLLLDAILAHIILFTSLACVKRYVVYGTDARVALRVLTTPNIALSAFVIVDVTIVTALSVTAIVAWNTFGGRLGQINDRS